MKRKCTFIDLKDEDTLVNFLEKTWIDGVRIGMVCHEETVQELVDQYMPNFKEKLTEEE